MQKDLSTKMLFNNNDVFSDIMNVLVYNGEQVIQENLIQGMILDVVENEPLSKDSILWDQENVILTPHISGTFELDKARDLFIDIAIKNVNAFVHGEELINIVMK